MPEQKLTPEEISKVVDKIRKRYDEYIYKYFKPKLLKYAFEDSYIQAIKSGVDISSFLMAEISAVEELIRREEEKIVSDEPEAPPKETIRQKVERIVEEQKQRIRKYPEADFHPAASEELRSLLGAMGELEERYWEMLAYFLRETAYFRSSLSMVTLEGRLRHLASKGSEGVPSGLSRYMYHANRFPRNSLAIDREEKEYILECAFFLHDVDEILERVETNYPQLEASSRQGLKEIRDHVLGMIQDFRLKDFKRRK